LSGPGSKAYYSKEKRIMNIDLDEVGPLNEAVDFPLMFDKDGEPTHGFKIVGANSQQYQDFDRAWKVQQVKKTGRRGRGIDTKTDTGAAEFVDVTDAREFGICCACVVGIYGFTVGGVPAQPTPETLRALFEKRPTWRPKTVTAIENDSLFIKA
jgi:hypothetical protein